MVNISNGGRFFDYLLLSSKLSELPVNVPDGSTAYLVDTNVMYVFYSGNWYEV